MRGSQRGVVWEKWNPLKRDENEQRKDKDTILFEKREFTIAFNKSCNKRK